MKRSLEGQPGRSSRRAPNSPRMRRALLGVIVLLALILRIASYVDTPRPVDGAGLAADQAEMARNIVDHGKWFVSDPQALELIKAQQRREGRLLEPSRVDLSKADPHPVYENQVTQMPGLAPVLAGLWWLTGHESYALVQWLQILIDTGLVLVIYWIARCLTSSTRISLFAALLYAVWAGSIVVVMRPVLDTWATFFTIACVGAFVWARERPHTLWRLVPLGVLAGLGIYFRPFVALLPLVLGLIAAPQPTLRRRLVWAALPTGIALLVLSPWTIRNYHEFHRFIPTRTGLGQAVYLGVGGASGDEGAAATVHKKDPTARYGSPQYDDFLVRAAVRQIIDNPRYYGSLILNRTRFLLPCLLVVLVWRRWKTAGLILVGTAMTTSVPYLFIGGDTRFYLPAAFAYLILGSMATAVVLSQSRRLIASGGYRDLVAALPHRQVDQWVVSGPSKESS
jgi:4-amino-4-deoxy-L-arabinose transferase-like glycosyltransferase